MHDPSTLVYGSRWFDVWHCDPETDGTDDSCGWFMRARHCDKVTLDQIARDFEFEWTHGCPYGWFAEDGSPNYSSHAIVLAMFRIAANNHFGHWSRGARKFLNNNLYDILHFAENSCDSLHDAIIQHYGPRHGTIKEQAHCMAQIVYAWLMRAIRPWWKHPRWHFWHWQVVIHPIQKLKRWLFSRCTKCGKRFPWGYAPVTHNWHNDGPRWFRGEKDVYHHECSGVSVSCCEVMEAKK